MKKSEIIEILLLVIIAMSFLTIFGAVGGLENNQCTIKEFLEWEIPSVILLVVSGIGIKHLEDKYW